MEVQSEGERQNDWTQKDEMTGHGRTKRWDTSTQGQNDGTQPRRDKTMGHSHAGTKRWDTATQGQNDGTQPRRDKTMGDRDGRTKRWETETEGQNEGR